MVFGHASERICTLTYILIGLAFIALGLYMQTPSEPVGIEAFQASEGVEAVAATPATPAFSGASSSVPEDEELKRKMGEIRTMLAAITTNKPKQDLTLNGLLDAEVLNTLDTMVEEVKFFDSKPPSPELEMFLTHLNHYSTLNPEQQTKVKSMIYTGHQIATVLYYIYMTLPTMIISTGVVVDPKTTSDEGPVDPSVAREMKSTITSLLAGLPKLSTKLEETTKRLMSIMEKFTDINRANSDFLETLLSTYNDYYRLCNLKVQGYKRQISTQKIAADSTFNKETLAENKFLLRSGQNITLTIQACIDFIQMFLDTVTPIQMKVDEAIKEYSEVPNLIILKNTVDANIQTMTLTKTSITYAEKVMAPKKEGFLSAGNPYGAATPNIFQALKFRIGKEVLVTEVNQSSLI
jgi:hypothetical protein